MKQKRKLVWVIIPIICVLAVLYILLFPSICKENSYRIVQKAGKYYLRFDDIYYYHELYDSDDPLVLYYLKYNSHNIPHQFDKFSMLSSKLYFSSVGEMKKNIYTANFNETQLFQLAKYVSSNYHNTKMIPIFDPEHLYEPKFPSDYQDYGVEWPSKSSRYTCKLSSSRSKNERATWDIIPLTEYFAAFDRLLDYESYRPYPYSGGFTEIVHVSDRNATEYHLGGNHKDVIYQFEDHGTTYTVLEKYRGDSLPDNITLYADAPEICFKVWIDGLTERPSLEWLAQFGAIKYE